MNKLFKVLSTTLLIFTIVSAFAFTPGTSLNKEIDVCAQAGISCIRNVGECEDGYLKWDLSDSVPGSIPFINLNGSNMARLRQRFRDNYPAEVVCINQSQVGSIIKFVQRGSVDDRYIVYDGNVLHQEVARYCPVSMSVGVSLENYAACCPVDTTNLVPVAEIRMRSDSEYLLNRTYDRDTLSYVACCPEGFNYYTANIGAPRSLPSGQCVMFDSFGGLGFSRNDTLTGAILEIIPGSSYQTFLSGYVIDGLDFRHSTPAIGANFICPDPSYRCVTFKDGSGANIQAPEDAGRLSGDSGNAFNDACDVCFKDGDIMGIDSTSGEVLICDGGRPTRPIRMEGVNNSISDTQACLRAEGGLSGEAFGQCKSCRESGGVWTGLGCQDTSPTGMITWIIRVAYGVMGGVALIQFIIAGIYYQTGQEDKVREARKGIMATITGLAVLTFSILILRIIGVNILDILPVGTI
jgi:hypothetical protein